MNTWIRFSELCLGLLLISLFINSEAVADTDLSNTDEAALIRLLGDPSYSVREHASKELLRRGRAVLPALQQGAQQGDLEIKATMSQVASFAPAE